MSYITTCTKCSSLYQEPSSEASNEPDRKCLACFKASRGEHAAASSRVPELMLMTTGRMVEDLVCYGWPHGFVLGEQKRGVVIEFARRFEECSHSREELAAMPDAELVRAAYWAMAEYASGQV